MLRITASLSALALLSGCAGVATLPVYESQSPAWSTGRGGNPFVFEHGAGRTELSITGQWPHLSWVGPIPLPLFPVPYPGNQPITILVKTNGEPQTELNPILIADGVVLEPVKSIVVQEPVKSVTRERKYRYKQEQVERELWGIKGRYLFRSSEKYPSLIQVKLKGFPDIDARVERERCYWAGDSWPTYGPFCSDAAKSADPH